MEWSRVISFDRDVPASTDLYIIGSRQLFFLPTNCETSDLLQPHNRAHCTVNKLTIGLQKLVSYFSSPVRVEVEIGKSFQL